jgi:(p)ppGpp synthase/HD superfamily hydrolase
MAEQHAGIVERARAFAIGVHRAVDQKRKYTHAPYEEHLEEVAALVARFGGDENMVAAAWLHDTVEDTQVTPDVIAREFGADVAALVSDLTDVSRPEDGNRAARKAIDCAHSGKASPRAKTIKLADVCSNLSSVADFDPAFARVYIPEKKAQLDVLGEGDAALVAHAGTIVEQAQRTLDRKG